MSFEPSHANTPLTWRALPRFVHWASLGRLGVLSDMELTEAAPGVFALASEYEDRAVPKRAGFRWHAGEHKRKSATSRAWSHCFPYLFGFHGSSAASSSPCSMSERSSFAK